MINHFKSFKNEIKGKVLRKAEIVLCPPSVYLESFASNLRTKTVTIGAQNMFWEGKGSYTGEISPQMIKNLKADYVIVGHSERRKYFGETDEKINFKIKAALKNKARCLFIEPGLIIFQIELSALFDNCRRQQHI